MSKLKNDTSAIFMFATNKPVFLLNCFVKLINCVSAFDYFFNCSAFITLMYVSFTKLRRAFVDMPALPVVCGGVRWSVLESCLFRRLIRLHRKLLPVNRNAAA